MNILFWNTNRKSYMDPIIELVNDKEIDVIILAEFSVSARKLAQSIQAKYPSLIFNELHSNHKRFKILTKKNPNTVNNFNGCHDGTTWSVNKFSNHFSIVAVHLPSRLNWDTTSISFEAINMMSKIRNYEKKEGKKTILIGDFNMNPYELGMISSIGIHGVKDKSLAKKNKQILEVDYDRFYNPMWRFLGDLNDVPGTYFYSGSAHDNTHWHTFDQILLRPELYDKYPNFDVEVVTNIVGKSLIQKKTKRIIKKISDHLPIILTLKK